MKSTLPLLLNLVVLIVNLCVSLGATETQARVLRATSRVAFDRPLEWALPASAAPVQGGDRVPGDPPPLGAQAPGVRLLRYLARLEGVEELGSRQMAALHRALERCAREFRTGAETVRALSAGGARTQRICRQLQDRLRSDAEAVLRDAAIPDGELLHRLVRVVLASAGS